MRMGRLDPYQIRSSIYLGRFFNEIREGQTNQAWAEVAILPGDILKPENIAYRTYGVDFTVLKPVVCVAAGLDDMRGELVPGRVIRLPSSAWIRRRIKHYLELEEEKGVSAT